jgi:hypothetical protein
MGETMEMMTEETTININPLEQNVPGGLALGEGTNTHLTLRQQCLALRLRLRSG